VFHGVRNIITVNARSFFISKIVTIVSFRDIYFPPSLDAEVFSVTNRLSSSDLNHDHGRLTDNLKIKKISIIIVTFLYHKVLNLLQE
jgi:hypothetical protein